MQKKSIENFGFDIQYVKNIELIKTPEYVYDIEVEGNHRFFANYVLVHNTDSIMFSFDNKKDEALSMLKKINESLPGTMELEVENFYKRGIFVLKRTGELGAKKKYALLSDKGEIKVRGFETVRRDRCKLAKETQDYVLKAVLEEGNSKNALDYVEKVVKQLKEKKIAIEQLVIKTQLKKEIESYESIGPHVIVAKKMRERGLPVKEGSLIEFVIAKGKGKLIRERAEIPDEVEEGDYDIDYYINNQVLPAVESIFSVFSISTNDMQGKKQKSLGEF
jgi:DNA polymerase I